METVGDILKAAREEEGYTLKEIALQTNMGSKYLTAIEENRFEIFPSETHIIGFIRNYSSFLEIDPAPLIEIYKRQILQETPTPLEELTAPRKAKVNPIFFITILGVLCLFVIALFLIQKKGNDAGDNHNTSSSSSSSAPLPLKDTTKDFALGEYFILKFKNSEKQLRFEAISNNAAIIKLDNKQIIIPANKKAEIDFDRDGKPDLQILINNIKNQTINASISSIKQTASSSSTTSSSSDASSSSSSKSKPQKLLKGKTILRSQDKVEINLTVTAKGIATLNVIKDNNQRASYFLKKGKKVSILAKNTLLISVSNPGNLHLNLNNVDLGIDTPNAVASFLFKWRRNPEDGKHHLEYEKISR